MCNSKRALNKKLKDLKKENEVIGMLKKDKIWFNQSKVGDKYILSHYVNDDLENCLFFDTLKQVNDWKRKIKSQNKKHELIFMKVGNKCV